MSGKCAQGDQKHAVVMVFVACALKKDLKIDVYDLKVHWGCILFLLGG